MQSQTENGEVGSAVKRLQGNIVDIIAVILQKCMNISEWSLNNADKYAIPITEKLAGVNSAMLSYNNYIIIL